LRRGATRSALAALAALAVQICADRPLSAQEVYKSVDAEGHVSYSDRGATKTSPKTAVRVQEPDPAEVARLARQQELLENSERERVKQQALADKTKAAADRKKQQACQSARNNYFRLKDSARVYQRDADGNRVYYSDSDADAMREQARRAMTAVCGT
jgi:Domain of unknown function (DUF4124)